ncbi:MAG: glycosyl hydrolase [Acidobacteria bacterium]|nr:glycosyl hydrolase [Acidobacteriota bacterium]MCA1636925.1 glycosyl hydrolase [Acidobacteriota bacterium]
MRLFRPFLSLSLLLFACTVSFAQNEIKPTATVTPTPSPTPTPEVKVSPSPSPEASPTPKPEPMSTTTFGGMRFRSIGPAVTSGRVNMFAVDPEDRAKYYVAVASGGVWKTINAGTTWTPVFDNEGSFSIGAIALDPKNSATVWVGTGEYNSQRSVGYGDGVYRSDDGGRSWKNVGLKKSEHIGRIAIDPRDSNVVYVAAQGPLWSAGGDRGLYKTTDGGKTWKQIIVISENTGVTDVVIDPSNPDTLYAAAWQRRRHFYTLINGGPESAIYKSTDAGNTWTKLRSGLPPGDLGRIGLSVSPVDTDVVYATVEASGNLSGIFRSNDRGATWERMSPNIAQGMYYGQIVADPKNVDRVYIPNVIFQVSDDGGRTQKPLGERLKHVDNHAIWIDPKNTDYYLVGSDGGVYESFDRGANWHFKANLPVTQFYDVTVDNSAPFYNVYGGTQDNNSLGGPARTRNAAGIMNSDWFVTNGGDGFRTQVDPIDPNIIYSESQNGGLVRFDKRTGERFDIAPFPEREEESQRTNWDTPFIISPHSRTRLYFAGHRLFRTDNQGDDWRVISDDLTRRLDRNALPVMGKIWGPDAVGKNQSTALYGNASALAESPLKEALIYVGTDDGLIQITEDGGKNWRKIDKFPGVPNTSYVSRIFASQHDANTVYATFNNHQNGDFKPYILKSTNTGRTWTSVAGNLPERGSLYAVAEDHVNPRLLFVGTEFSFFFSVDGGAKWIQMKGGLPTVAVRDIAIQKRENDLILATFGRGFYVLDNYAPLREISTEALNKTSALFPVKDALMYIRSNAPFTGFQGASFYLAPNPPYGATFTYYLKDAPKTLKQKRQEAEREAEKKKQPFRYPSIEELRAETEEEPPAIVFTITDSEGKIVRRVSAPAAQGIQRATWDFRYAPPYIPATPPQLLPGLVLPEGATLGPQGPLAMPGKYSVTMELRAGGMTTALPGSQSFEVTVEGREKMTAEEGTVLADFQRKVSMLQRGVNGAIDMANTIKNRIGLLKRSAQEAPAPNQKLVEEARALEAKINEITHALRGGRETSDIPPPSIKSRVDNITDTIRLSSTRPTQTQLDQYNYAVSQFNPVLARLRTLVDVEIPRLEKVLDEAGAPLTPGRLPQ